MLRKVEVSLPSVPGNFKLHHGSLGTKLLYELRITHPVTHSLIWPISQWLCTYKIFVVVFETSSASIVYILKCFFISKNCFGLSIKVSTCLFPFMSFTPMDSLSLCFLDLDPGEMFTKIQIQRKMVDLEWLMHSDQLICSL